MATPFRFRSALNPDDPNDQRVMVPPDELVKQVVGDIQAFRYPLIQGPRQMGKSTACLWLVQYVRQQRARDWLARYVDCQALAGADTGNLVSLLHNRVLEEALRYADLGVPQADVVKTRLSNIARPVTLYQFSLFLEEISRVLPDLTRLVLVVDEIEGIPQQTLYDALCAFRALHHKYSTTPGPFACCVVIACTYNLAALRLGAGSPYNMAEIHHLEEVTREQWMSVLSQAGCLQFEQPALKRLFDEVGGHPYLLQRVCDRAVINAEEAGAERVREDHVLDGIFWLFEKGDRNLRIMSQEADASPARRAVCDSLLQGRIVAFESTLDPINDLADVGLIVNRDRRATFRNRGYERVMLNRRYAHLSGPKGDHLRQHGYLLVGCSEIQ